MHSVPRPANARLMSLRQPLPQRFPRHPQWRGRQGSHYTSQGSSRTSGGRPQPRTQSAAPHTNLPRSSTPNGFPAKRYTNKHMQCHQTNAKTYYLLKSQLSLGDCESTVHTPPSTPGIIAATLSSSHHRKPVQGSPGTIRPRGLKPFRPPSCRGV